MKTTLSRFVWIAALSAAFSAFTFGQGGNSVSGHVFGYERRPVDNIVVELLDELGRTISRTRTNPSGRYFFHGVSSGRIKVKVLSMGTDYVEQEQEYEIINFSRTNQAGQSRLGGFENVNLDFNLKLRRGLDPSTTGAFFVQEIPKEAEALYKKAVDDLSAKREAEGLAGLRSSIEIFPKYYVALERLGSEYVRLGHYDAARILLTIAVDVNKRGYASWYGLAHALYSLKDYTAATTAIAKAVELNPASPDALILSGVLMKHNKQFEAAEKQLVKARGLAEDKRPQIHWELALLYANNLKRYADAAKELRQFLKAQPDAKDAEKIKTLIADLDAKAKS